MAKVTFEDEFPENTDARLTPHQKRDFFARMKRVVVTVETEMDDGRFQRGTGFILNSEGYVMTCAHLVPTDSVAVGIVTEDYDRYARVIARDNDLDIAIVKALKQENEVEDPVFDFSGFGINDSIYAGMELFVIAHPGGLQYTFVSGNVASERVRTVGEIIRKDVDFALMDLDESLEVIQINNSHLMHGASGSPFFDSSGRVMGMTSFILKECEFAIPVNTLKRFCESHLPLGIIEN